MRFYNESRAELFEQIAWHSTDSIHHRSLICADLAARLPGRDFLDFGSGIEYNALVFGLQGFRVTLADVADPLRNFATWRCERRGIAVHAIDLKHKTLPKRGYDVIACFDVLEHVPDPLQAVKSMRDALRPPGIIFLYAPFGFDPDRPMHIIHRDPVTAKIRSLGFSIRHDWEQQFPDYLQTDPQNPFPPRPYQHVIRSPLTNAAYYVRDVWLNGPVTDAFVDAVRALTLAEKTNAPAPDRCAGMSTGCDDSTAICRPSRPTDLRLSGQLPLRQMSVFTQATNVKFFTEGLWCDEAFSWAIASKGSALLALTARDFNPPLYYLVLNGWMTIAGTSEMAMRSPSRSVLRPHPVSSCGGTWSMSGDVPRAPGLGIPGAVRR